MGSGGSLPLLSTVYRRLCSHTVGAGEHHRLEPLPPSTSQVGPLYPPELRDVSAPAPPAVRRCCWLCRFNDCDESDCLSKILTDDERISSTFADIRVEEEEISSLSNFQIPNDVWR